MDAPLSLVTAPSLLERYITILFMPLIGLAVVLLPFIVFALYTWWSQRGHWPGGDWTAPLCSASEDWPSPDRPS